MSPLDGYLRHLSVERGLSKNTLSAYKSDLSRYLTYLEQLSLDVVTVNANHLSDFSAELVTQGLKASSNARILAAVRGFHRFLLLENLRRDDPTVKLRPPRLAKRLPKSLTQDQVMSLLKVSGPEPEDESTDLIRLRDRAILELMYSTGTRVSEVVDLDLDEVNDSGLLRVRGKGSKERIVPIGTFAARSLDAYLVRSRPSLVGLRGERALFLNKRGGRLSRQSIWEIIQRSGDACGVAVSPHSLRHSFATHLIEGGADVRVVQELLGHASVATTQIYTLVTIDTLREVYASAHPRARG
ncbi:MAG: site-specific tyrosine recombinase XerD [Actinobacteria bacterium]|uniref:Tyrosine recombinase XerD n=1 Tax=freshwater metagenome TaxID=449393 RepID=A0A6J6CM26_9ZZZZ|nr:site-specific tyrosine recombinase XerD [Actinomycetota bacterium]